MANLVRIRDVFLYSAFNDDVAECRRVAKLLQDNNIPFNHLMYDGAQEIENALEPIKTWWFSESGVDAGQRENIRFPFVHWKNIFDDDISCINIAVGEEEISNSQLVLNKEKVVIPNL